MRPQAVSVNRYNNALTSRRPLRYNALDRETTNGTLTTMTNDDL